jgi:hypothetical protein
MPTSRRNQPLARCFLLSLTASLVLMPTSAVAAEKLLRWKLRPGELIRVTFDQDMKMQTSLLGNEMESAADMAMVMNWDVENVSGQGVAQIKQSIERLRLKMHTPGADPIEYDTAQQEKPQGLASSLANSLAPLIGMEFMQKMSDRGEILDVQLSESAAAALAKEPSGAQLQQIFSHDGLKALLNQTATVLPAEPVTPGDTWTGSSQNKSAVGTMVMEMTYTYCGSELHNGRLLERIDVQMDVSFGAGPNALGLNVDVKEQNNHGSLYFDADAGHFVNTTLQQSMTLETAIGDRVHRQQLSTVMEMTFTPVSRTAKRPGQVASGQNR